MYFLANNRHVGAKATDLQEKLQACGGAQGLPRVLRARWIPKIKTWMDIRAMLAIWAKGVKFGGLKSSINHG